MSTTTPNPSRSGLSPFKDQTPYDPYLPSSPDEEQLQQISAEHPPQELHVRNNASAGARHGHADGAQALANRSAGYNIGSRADTFGLEGFEPQGFENTLLEENFDDLPGLYDVNDMSLFRHTSFKRTDTGRTDEPQSAATSRDTAFSRRSTGLATHSSQLMSPVLTDAASPDPADLMGSTGKTRLLGGGEMSRVSSASTANAGQHGTIAERTPALTTSSYEVTPNMADQQQPLFPPITPSIQVDYHKRGDSPARTDEDDARIQKRRRGSRSSSLLAAATADDSEDVPDNVESEQILRHGIAPSARGEGVVASLKEQTHERDVAKKNEQISKWLSVTTSEKTDPNAPELLTGGRGNLKPAARRRAASHSNPADLQADAFGINQGIQAQTNARTPGPGLLVDEDSGDEDDDVTGSYIESAPPSVDGNEAAVKAEELDQFPPLEVQSPEQEAHPWADPIYIPSHPDFPSQPGTSNAAMARFLKRAQDIETASRVATWGTTQRRMSDGDLNIERVFGPQGLLARLSISKERHPDRSERDREEWRGFRETMERAADKIRTKRTNSTSKRKGSEPTRPVPEKSQSYDANQKRKDSASSSKHERKESLSGKASGHHSLLSRIPSGSKRPKSPRINTSGIAAAVTTQVGALGAGSLSPTGPSTPMNWGDRVKEKLGFHHRQPSEGPDAAHVSSPPPLSESRPTDTIKPVEIEEDAEGDEDMQGVTMDIAPVRSHIIPTFEGFKAHARESNPRLPNFLVERLGQEQLRRYKKLVSFKVEHTRAKELGKCSSGAACADRGGHVKYFPAKNVPKATAADDDEDDEAVADGIVTEAQFPQGLPMPPAKRLPAEFECPLCFQVKRFQKPSDWSKHVHEDLQPFTCTFQHCSDPKSFKRKADWVRHENERHRQLEWWQCTEDGCSHLCYRRDNFVQHLVREHKLPEPKSKNPRPNKPAVRGPAKSKPKAKGIVNIHDVPLEDRVLYMVEVCRRETSKDPMQEPCRFCGNHCNSFKKLTVHLARHMESLSLPVLELVKAKDVSSDTIISPIDIKLSQQGLSPMEAPPGYNGNLGTTEFSNNMSSGHGANLVGMTPVMSASNFQNPHYPTADGWGSTHAHMSGNGIQTYSNDIDGSNWQTSAAIYDPPMAAAYTNFHNGPGFAQQHPVTSPDMYNTMNSNMSPPNFAQASHFQTPNYMGTDHQHGTTDAMGLPYEGGAGGPFSQATNSGIYGAAGQHGQSHGADQRSYYGQY